MAIRMATAWAGKPTDCKTMIMVTMPALGIPGAPMDAIMAVRTTIICDNKRQMSPA